MSVIRGPLNEESTKVVAAILQDTLVDLIDLAVFGKHLHWSIAGARFLSVHPHLDDIIDMARDQYDDVAERSAGIGVAPDGRVQTVARDTPLPVAPTGYIAVKDVLRLMTEALRTVSSRLYPRIDQLNDIDLVTQDLLNGIAIAVDKQAWMIQAENAPMASSETVEMAARLRSQQQAL